MTFVLCNIVLACIKGLFEKRFAKVPEEIVSMDKSDLAEQLASKPDELQEQAAAEQVGFYTPL